MKNFLTGFLKQDKNHLNAYAREKNKIYALQRSEIIDDCTCKLCLLADGIVISQNDELSSISLFHEGCRGIWVQIMKDEIDPPPITGVSANIKQLLIKKP